MCQVSLTKALVHVGSESASKHTRLDGIKATSAQTFKLIFKLHTHPQIQVSGGVTGPGVQVIAVFSSKSGK